MSEIDKNYDSLTYSDLTLERSLTYEVLLDAGNLEKQYAYNAHTKQNIVNEQLASVQNIKSAIVANENKNHLSINCFYKESSSTDESPVLNHNKGLNFLSSQNNGKMADQAKLSGLKRKHRSNLFFPMALLGQSR